MTDAEQRKQSPRTRWTTRLIRGDTPPANPATERPKAQPVAHLATTRSKTSRDTRGHGRRTQRRGCRTRNRLHIRRARQRRSGATPGNADNRDEGATGATGEPTLRESSNTCRSAAGTASVAGETGSGSEDGISEATGPAGAATGGGSTATGLSSRACAAGSGTAADDSSKHEPESGSRPLTGPSDRGAGSAWTGSQASVADGCANAGNGLRGGSANGSRSTPARTT